MKISSRELDIYLCGSGEKSGPKAEVQELLCIDLIEDKGQDETSRERIEISKGQS